MTLSKSVRWLFELFFRKRSSEAESRARYSATVIGYRADVIAAAEQKLGRLLSEEERRGIESINSLMWLESLHMGCISERSSPRQVEADLAFFAKEARAMN